jgi:hypothetical protein
LAIEMRQAVVCFALRHIDFTIGDMATTMLCMVRLWEHAQSICRVHAQRIAESGPPIDGSSCTRLAKVVIAE